MILDTGSNPVISINYPVVLIRPQYIFHWIGFSLLVDRRTRMALTHEKVDRYHQGLLIMTSCYDSA